MMLNTSRDKQDELSLDEINNPSLSDRSVSSEIEGLRSLERELAKRDDPESTQARKSLSKQLSDLDKLVDSGVAHEVVESHLVQLNEILVQSAEILQSRSSSSSLTKASYKLEGAETHTTLSISSEEFTLSGVTIEVQPDNWGSSAQIRLDQNTIAREVEGVKLISLQNPTSGEQEHCLSISPSFRGQIEVLAEGQSKTLSVGENGLEIKPSTDDIRAKSVLTLAEKSIETLTAKLGAATEIIAREVPLQAALSEELREQFVEAVSPRNTAIARLVQETSTFDTYTALEGDFAASAARHGLSDAEALVNPGGEVVVKATAADNSEVFYKADINSNDNKLTIVDSKQYDAQTRSWLPTTEAVSEIALEGTGTDLDDLSLPKTTPPSADKSIADTQEIASNVAQSSPVAEVDSIQRYSSSEAQYVQELRQELGTDLQITATEVSGNMRYDISYSVANRKNSSFSIPIGDSIEIPMTSKYREQARSLVSEQVQLLEQEFSPRIEAAYDVGYELRKTGGNYQWVLPGMTNSTDDSVVAEKYQPRVSSSEASGIELAKNIVTALYGGGTSGSNEPSALIETRRLQKDLIDAARSKKDVAFIVEVAEQIGMEDSIDTRQLEFDGFQQRAATVLGDLIQQAPSVTGLSHTEIREVETAVLANLRAVHRSNPEYLGSMSKEQASSFAVSLAKHVVNLREQVGGKVIIGGATQGIGLVHEEFTHHAVRELGHVDGSYGPGVFGRTTYRGDLSNLDTREVQALGASNSASKAIYLWGHGSFKDLSLGGSPKEGILGKVAHSLIEGERSRQGTSGPLELSHITCILDGCMQGTAVSEFKNYLREATGGQEIGSYPQLIATSPDKMPAYNTVTTNAANGDVLKTDSHFLRELRKQTGSEQVNMGHVLDAASTMSAGLGNAVENWNVVLTDIQGQVGSWICVNGQAPVLFDTKPVDVENLVEQISDSISASGGEPLPEFETKSEGISGQNEDVLLQLSSLQSLDSNGLV